MSEWKETSLSELLNFGNGKKKMEVMMSENFIVNEELKIDNGWGEWKEMITSH